MSGPSDAMTSHASLDGLTQVDTGNGEPDLYRDEIGNAYWPDGALVTAADMLAMEPEDNEIMCAVMDREGLVAL